MANENNQLFKGLGAGALEVPSDLILTAQDQLTPLLTITRLTGNITAPVAGVTFTGIPSAGQVLTATSSFAANWQAASAAIPGGSNQQIQFNNSGAFGGTANISFDGTRLVATSCLFGNATANNNSTVEIGPRASGPVAGRCILELNNASKALAIEVDSGGATHTIGVNDSTSDLKIFANTSLGILFKNTSGLVIVQGRMQFNDNTTGGGTASLSNNCPAVTPTSPYTWVKIQTSDGSIAYVPAWK